MRTIAMRAGLAPSALVRFAQHLGYPGWPALKQVLATEMGLVHQPYEQRASALRQRPADGRLIDEVTHSQTVNLDEAARQNVAALEHATDLLRGAQAVHVAGFRACFGLAASFVYVYGLMRSGVHLLHGQGGQLEVQLHAIAPGDAVMVISFAPYSAEALAAVRRTSEVGAWLIGVTDSAASPIALQADATLVFPTCSPSFFPSTLAASGLLETLLSALAARADEAALQRLKALESALFQSGAYVATEPRGPVNSA